MKCFSLFVAVLFKFVSQLFYYSWLHPTLLFGLLAHVVLGVETRAVAELAIRTYHGARLSIPHVVWLR